ncbi:E3 ubiquitin-protein ligase CHIP [Nymphaea colorata]|nr:E3 ubiquitin-protein ligase CHIP [Nymphaea colorata]
MAPTFASAERQAELLKQEGNTFFKKDRIGAAIEAYTEAITLCPDRPVYWTNRAICYRKRSEWDKVERDCKTALELDSGSVKAHYMLGLALLQRDEHELGIVELEKALDLGRVANPVGYMVEEIWRELAKAKYREWMHVSTKELENLERIRKVCENALVEQYARSVSEASAHSTESATPYDEQLNGLAEVFRKAAEAKIPTEVPDYLCCKITLEIFRDPVITPSGVTYERAVIIEHLRKVGKFDPVTREPLDERQLVPNLALKKAVQDYLDKHGWAYQMG